MFEEMKWQKELRGQPLFVLGQQTDVRLDQLSFQLDRHHQFDCGVFLPVRPERAA